MEANLKNTLPQEGTGFTTAGESLGELSGSSRPSYSGGGNDRFRHDVPHNKNTGRRSEIPECPSMNQSSKTFDVERIIAETTVTKSVLEEKSLALEIKRASMRNMEEQSNATLQEHILDGVVIVEKVASLIVDPRERRTLQDASLKIKNLIVKIMDKEAKRILTRSQVLLLRRELEEKKEIVSRGQALKGINKSSNSESISKHYTKQDDRQLKSEQELEEMVKAFQIKRRGLGYMEDESPTTLHKHILEGVAIIKNVATLIGDKDQLILEKAALDVKYTVDGYMMNLSNLTQENPLEIEGEPLKPVQPHHQQSENSAPCTLETSRLKLDGDALTHSLKKYLKNTIYDYINTRERKLLNKWEIQHNANATPCTSADTDIETHKKEKRKLEARSLSPVAEPVYDVWSEMDQFRDYAMARIEEDAAKKTLKWLYDPEKRAESKVCKNSDEEAVSRLMQKPDWWTAEVAELRSTYMAARRQYSRARRRRQRDEAVEMELYAVYRTLKKTLKAAIKKAKSGEKLDDDDSED